MSCGAEATGSGIVGMRRLARSTTSALSQRRAWTSVSPIKVPRHARRFAASSREEFGGVSETPTLDSPDIETRRASSSTTSSTTPVSSGSKTRVVSPFTPSGDQPTAIANCYDLLNETGLNRKVACLRGATGTGKTFVVANVIDKLTKDTPKPTLVVVPNKTLAAQVARELRGYLSDTKRVELFVSHFSLYVPESFSKGRYVEKRSAIDKNLYALRHRATKSLVESDDVVIVASVSCLYGLGMPVDYVNARMTLDSVLSFPKGRDLGIPTHLTEQLLYEQSKEGASFVKSGQWAWAGGGGVGGVAGLTNQSVRRLVIWPPYEENAFELDLDVNGTLVAFGVREKSKTTTMNPSPDTLTIWPRQHHITPPERLKQATDNIMEELEQASSELQLQGNYIEADRLRQRVTADVGLLNEIGWCPGAEHYSRHLGGRSPGAPPVTLLDYLGFRSDNRSDTDNPAETKTRDWLLVADESHVMLPQLKAMHGGDRSRKLGLVDGGYRLPSALDNRPLTFDEFWQRVPKALLVSATPGDTENKWCASGGFFDDESSSVDALNPETLGRSEILSHISPMVDMVVRPSGVLDPKVHIFPKEKQLQKLAGEIRAVAKNKQAALVCCLTKNDCEDLAGYLNQIGGISADWIHSGLTTPERAVKLQKLQQGEIDCLVGAQLLREGLDLPQVSLVVILDANVPGFMRSSRSLMQMMGRAARNKNGQAILFADEPYSLAMQEAIGEVTRRREKQKQYNLQNNITPQTASAGSANASLSLFEVMRDEIEGTKNEIQETKNAAEMARGGGAQKHVDTSSQQQLVPSQEEVDAAMLAWRLKRAGADADQVAYALQTEIARERLESIKSEVGPVWNALAKEFSEQEFTDALFSEPVGVTVDDDDTSETLDKKEPSRAEAVLSSFGLDNEHVDSLRLKVNDLPAKTGVYRWLDVNGDVLYIGKAKNLRNRTKGYLSSALLRASPRHRRLLSRARSIDTVLTPGGEQDALVLEARLIQRTQPPLNVLLKHAQQPDAVKIVATLDDKVAPRFFIMHASDGFGNTSNSNTTPDARNTGTNPNPPGGGGGGVRTLGFDGSGGLVSPGVVKKARNVFAEVDRGSTLGDAPEGIFDQTTSDGHCESSVSQMPRPRSWLRASRNDARRVLFDLETALDLRGLAFRARHGDQDAYKQLVTNARLAAAALDGGEHAELIALNFENDGNFNAATSIRNAAASDASALGALSGLLQEASLANSNGQRGISVDVVAAANQGKHCAVQIVKVRDGTIEGIFSVFAELPERSFGRPEDSSEKLVGEKSFASREVDWLGVDADEVGQGAVQDVHATLTGTGDDSELLKSRNSHRLEEETVLGEATQRALEMYYGLDDMGENSSDDSLPEQVFVSGELPHAVVLERVLKGARGKAADETLGRMKKKSCQKVLRHGSDLPEGLPTALAALAKANAVEAARKAANNSDAAEDLRVTLGVRSLGRSNSAQNFKNHKLVVEGVDISHLAGGSTAASVVVFVDGTPQPTSHKRYAISYEKDGVTPGDDPSAIRAAISKRIASAKRGTYGKKNSIQALDATVNGQRPPNALPDLLLIDGGPAQLLAAARACLEGGVEVSNAHGGREREGDFSAEGDSEQVSATVYSGQIQKSNSKKKHSVTLASLAKGRVSGEESVFVPVAVFDVNGVVVDFETQRLVVGPGVAKTRAGKSSAASNSPGLRLLRSVRDESHAVALGAHRRRRRSLLFSEMNVAVNENMREEEDQVATG